MASIKATNSATGAQYLNPGEGTQSIANEHGRVFNYHGQQTHINITASDVSSSGFVLKLKEGEYLPSEPTHAGIIDWLMKESDHTPIDCAKYHNELLRQLIDDTGTWFLEDHKFSQWKDLSKSSQVLWVSGNLGSGKTMLLAKAVEFLKNEIKGQQDSACVYFYFQEEAKNELSLPRIWGTLLKQLLEHDSVDLAEELKARFNKPLHGSTRPSPHEYFDLFRAQAAMFKKAIYLIIDDWDRCQDALEKLDKTHVRIEHALEKLPDQTRLLYTTNNGSLEEHDGKHKERLVVSPTRHDIEAYVDHQIKNSRTLQLMNNDNRQMVKMVKKHIWEVTKSSKMFLLARLHMSNLRTCYSPAEIREALKSLPDSAFKVFDGVARDIAASKGDMLGKIAKHTFTWVIFAKAQLTIEHIRESFAVTRSKQEYKADEMPDGNLILSSCKGLIVTDNDPEKKVLSLIHKSAQSYLQDQEVVPKLEYVDSHIANTCLSCLLMDFPGRDELKSPQNLLKYSVEHWREHLSKGENPGTDSKTAVLIMKFLEDNSKLTRAFRITQEGLDGGARFDGMTGLHAAVYFDLLPWAEHILQARSMDIDAQCADDQTALHWAVRYGRQDFIRLFLQPSNGQSANPDICDCDGNTPMKIALSFQTQKGVEMVELLLGAKANPDIVGKDAGYSPLILAIRDGPVSLAISMMKSYLQYNNLNAKDSRLMGSTLLRQVLHHRQEIAAAQYKSELGTEPSLQYTINNHTHILVDFLLERGVDLNQRLEDDWTPLLHCVKTGDLSTFRQLLNRRFNPVNVNLRQRDGYTALRWAVEYQRDEAVKLLIEHDADVNEVYSDEESCTALLQAVKRNFTSTVQVLLNVTPGADPNITTASGSTPLIEAVRMNNHEMVYMLLKAGARPDDLDGNQLSALLHAIKNKENGTGRKDLVWLLVTSGAQSTTEALKLALSNNYLSMAWFLCEYGASPNCIDENGRTLLHLAAQSGQLETVEFLLAHHVPLRLKDNKGSTALHYAVLAQWDRIVTVLASHAIIVSPQGQILDMLNEKGKTALMLAAGTKGSITLRTLLKYGASVKLATPSGHTALHIAADQCFHEGVRSLLDAGGNPNAVDKWGFTALHHSVKSHSVNVLTLRMLKDFGADLDARDKYGRNPLMLASQQGNTVVVRWLLKEGANPGARDKEGFSVWDYAVRSQSREVQDLIRYYRRR